MISKISSLTLGKGGENYQYTYEHLDGDQVQR